MIKTDLSGFVVAMHSGLCEQYVEPLSLMASGLDFLFAEARVHCDNKPLQNRSLSLNHFHCRNIDSSINQSWHVIEIEQVHMRGLLVEP